MQRTNPTLLRALLALITLIALCFALGACIGPGLEPPEGGSSSSPRAGADDDGTSSDGGRPTGGDFGNAGAGTGDSDGPTRNPDDSEAGPTDPAVPSGEPGGEQGDEDAGVDPADSP